MHHMTGDVHIQSDSEILWKPIFSCIINLTLANKDKFIKLHRDTSKEHQIIIPYNLLALRLFNIIYNIQLLFYIQYTRWSRRDKHVASCLFQPEMIDVTSARLKLENYLYYYNGEIVTLLECIFMSYRYSCVDWYYCDHRNYWTLDEGTVTGVRHFYHVTEQAMASKGSLQTRKQSLLSE